MRRALAVSLCGLMLAASAPVAAARPCPASVARTAGGSWETRPPGGFRGNAWVWRLAADHRDPRFVVVADSEGIVVTRDGGCSWRRAAEFADYVTPFVAPPIDAVVAGSGRDRSAHVLIGRVAGAEAGPTLLSSYDDGATWTVTAAPVAAGPSGGTVYSLTSGPASPGTVYLLARNATATGAVYVLREGDEWRRQSTTAYAAPESCVAGTCVARTIDVLQADPARPEVLWAYAGPSLDPSWTLGRSSDAGRTWAHVSAPDPVTGRPLLDVAPTGTITMIGAFSRYAMSDDGGRTWAVGRMPEVVSGDSTNVEAFEIAHFDRGRAVATVLGEGPGSGWAGNVLVFDGSRWRHASPPGFSGYDRGVSFAALASTDGPLLALTSRGELMSFRL